MRETFKRLIVIICVTAALGALAFMILYSKIKFDIGVMCPLNEWLNIECPGCGVTRMCEALLEGKIYQAFRYNAYIFITGPTVAMIYIWQAFIYIKENRLLTYLDVFLVSFALGLAVFGIMRNISTFSWLAPTVVQ